MMRNPEAPPIRMLVLTLTGQCNFRCRYCYASEQEKRFMSVRTAVEAVRLAEKGRRVFYSSVHGRGASFEFSSDPRRCTVL